MENKRRGIKKSRRGMTLVIAVVIVVVLAMLGIGLLQLARNARLQAVKDVLQMSARSAADAGIEHAVRYMIDGWNTAPVKSAWLLGWDATIPGTDSGLPGGNPVSVSLDGTFGNASFSYNIYKGTKEDGYQIISTGTAAGVTRTVHAAVVLRSVFFGIGAKRDIYVSPGMKLGTVPDGGKFVMQTNSIDPAAITLKPNIVIPGDVVVGPGGDTDIAINLAKSVVITGDTKAAEDYIDFPPVYPPEYLVSSPYSIPRIDSNDPNIAYIEENIKLDELRLGTAPLNLVKTLKVIGNKVEVFVDGFTQLPPNTELIVTEGSSLVLYLGGDMELKSDIRYGDIPPVNDEEIEDAARAISIMGTVDPITEIPLCTEIQFFPFNDFYGTIYAPDADPLYIAPGGDFYGAVVGADNLTLKPVGTFNFVTALYEFPDIEVMYMGIKHGSWWEE